MLVHGRLPLVHHSPCIYCVSSRPQKLSSTEAPSVEEAPSSQALRNCLLSLPIWPLQRREGYPNKYFIYLGGGRHCDSKGLDNTRQNPGQGSNPDRSIWSSTTDHQSTTYVTKVTPQKRPSLIGPLLTVHKLTSSNKLALFFTSECACFSYLLVPENIHGSATQKGWKFRRGGLKTQKFKAFKALSMPTERVLYSILVRKINAL